MSEAANLPTIKEAERFHGHMCPGLALGYRIAKAALAALGLGLLAKPLLGALHVTDLIRLDLIIPTMLMLVTRLVVDKFGTLTLYELVMAMLAMLAWPGSFGVPGPLKIPLFLIKGLIWDLCMSALRRSLVARLLVTAIIGETVSTVGTIGIKLLLGLPWSPIVQVLWGVRLITTVMVGVLGAALALAVWRAIRDLSVVRRITAWRSG